METIYKRAPAKVNLTAKALVLKLEILFEFVPKLAQQTCHGTFLYRFDSI